MNVLTHSRFGSTMVAVTVMLLVAGCTVDRHDRVTTIGVPPGALRVREGNGRLAYDVPRAGEVFVTDADDETMVYRGRVHSSDRFVVDPDDNRIAVNGQRVIDRRLKGSHRHAIYFRED